MGKGLRKEPTREEPAVKLGENREEDIKRLLEPIVREYIKDYFPNGTDIKTGLSSILMKSEVYEGGSPDTEVLTPDNTGVDMDDIESKIMSNFT
jgi:hypothetical protein